MKNHITKVLFLYFFILSGCHVPSKVAMQGSGGRNAYNVAVEQTNVEEMLLNLVRMRFYDVPLFLEVSSITTQFSFRQNVSAGVSIPGFDHSNPVNLGGDLAWQNQPTIQYTPLQGQRFTEHLLSPIRLGTIQQLIYSGWDIDRLMRLVIQGIDQLMNAPLGTLPDPSRSPEYRKFFEVSGLLRKFQEAGDLQVGIIMKNCKKGQDSSEVLQFSFPKKSQGADRLAELLSHIKTNGTNDRYFISVEQGFDEMGEIGILPRTLLSCMYYLSQNVHVPLSDLKTGKVTYYKDHIDEKFSRLINIYSCKQKPKDAYVCVWYRNSWYYIEDNDLDSKRTFLLLLQLYQLQSGSEKSMGPILTLPVS